jgi:hypothetical protein
MYKGKIAMDEKVTKMAEEAAEALQDVFASGIGRSLNGHHWKGNDYVQTESIKTTSDYFSQNYMYNNDVANDISNQIIKLETLKPQRGLVVKYNDVANDISNQIIKLETLKPQRGLVVKYNDDMKFQDIDFLPRDDKSEAVVKEIEEIQDSLRKQLDSHYMGMFDQSYYSESNQSSYHDIKVSNDRNMELFYKEFIKPPSMKMNTDFKLSSISLTLDDFIQKKSMPDMGNEGVN